MKRLLTIGLVGIAVGLAMLSLSYAPADVEVVEETSEPVVTELVTTPPSPEASFDFVPTPTEVIEPTPTLEPTQAPTPTETSTPTPLPPVFDYFINKKINMRNGWPVAMVIHTADGREIKSNWASAIGYTEGDNADEVFSPYVGTVYSHIDTGFLATWIHSGRLKKADLFAWELEKAVWNTAMNLSSGHDLTSSLSGAVLTLCQANPESGVQAFDDFDPSQCPGEQVTFVITAAALIERENVDAYDSAVGDTVNWLIENDQGDGFDQLVPGEGYLLQTCVGRYQDQVSDGTKDYLYNRLILGLTVVRE